MNMRIQLSRLPVNIDLPRTLVTVAAIFATLYALERTPVIKGASKGKRFVLNAISLFIVLMIINLLWPSGS